MSKVGVAVLAALVLAAPAAAATPRKDMAAAMRALHYPKAEALKVGCRKAGPRFRCKALYRHNRHRVFYAAWASALGGRAGWICAGRKAAACKTLRHGFIPNSQIKVNGSVEFSADQAAQGYMSIFHNTNVTYAGSGCTTTTRPSTWTFCFAWTNNTSIGVTIHMAKTRSGYVTSATEAITQ